MKSLKKISLNYHQTEIPEVIELLLKVNVPVEWLTLTHRFEYDDFIDSMEDFNIIAKFNKLKVLEIINRNVFRMSDWIKCLSKLKE